jgi:hypothetical protein
VKAASKHPRVTRIAEIAFPVDTSRFTQFHRDRGTAMHKATELLDRGVLNEASVDSVISGRLAAYRHFLRDTGALISAIEEEVVSDAHGYAGRLDRRMLLPEWCRLGLRGGVRPRIAEARDAFSLNTEESVVDIKGPFCAPGEAIQLAGYAGTFDRPLVRYALHLHDDESYILEPHEGRRDWRVFLSCLEILNYRIANAR